MRTGALPLMWLILALISAVSLFGIAFIPSFAVAADLGLVVAGLAAGLLATVNGLGRSVAGRLSDQFGRRRVLAVVLAVEGFTQFGLAMAGQAGSSWAFVLCAMLAGVGGGAFYTILGNLILEYFGENSQLENHAILYSAKAVGACGRSGRGCAPGRGRRLRTVVRGCGPPGPRNSNDRALPEAAWPSSAHQLGPRNSVERRKQKGYHILNGRAHDRHFWTSSR